MKRARHLIAYDIREPKRLRLVHRAMRGFGMPFQYSVFVCDITSSERLNLLQQLASIIDPSEDCVAVVHLGDPEKEDVFTFLGPKPAMPSITPMIF